MRKRFLSTLVAVALPTLLVLGAPTIAVIIPSVSASADIELAPGDVLVSGTVLEDSGLFRVFPAAPPELVLGVFYSAFTFDAEGDFIANDVGDRVVRVDLTTGTETLLSDGGPLDTAADLFIADGVAYGVDDSASIEGVVAIDLETGVQSIVASKGNLYDPKGGTIGPDGLIYVADPGRFGFFEGRVVRIDPSSFDPGNLTANQTVIIAGRTGPTDVVFEANGDILVTDSVALVRFDSNGNEKGIVANFSPQVQVDIELDRDGNAVVAGFDPFRAGDAQVTRVAPGGTTTILTTGVRAPRTVAVVPVPEPGASLLGGAALVTLAVLAGLRGSEAAHDERERKDDETS
jgi:hypothetical protein